MRNSIECSSLGDKIYRHPTYEPNFYKEDGSIAGSTQILRKKNKARMNQIDFTQDKNVKWPLYPRVVHFCFY